jgi:hypothetical protein
MAENIARQDIKKRLGEIKTIGAGSSEEGTAYLILQMFDVAKRRLNNKGAIKVVYLDNEEAPQGLRDMMGRYVNDTINQKQAEKEIDEMQKAYQKILSQEYGLKPSRPFGVFMG